VAVAMRNDTVRDWILVICYPKGDKAGTNLGSHNQRWPAKPEGGAHKGVNK
jgi:hypothetical protein